jgi:hypothetical protein
MWQEQRERRIYWKRTISKLGCRAFESKLDRAMVFKSGNNFASENNIWPIHLTSVCDKGTGSTSLKLVFISSHIVAFVLQFYLRHVSKFIVTSFQAQDKEGRSEGINSSPMNELYYSLPESLALFARHEYCSWQQTVQTQRNKLIWCYIGININNSKLVVGVH